MQNLVGQSIGRYHIIEQLGEGGMAVVYKAFDTSLDCDVAVKIIRIDDLPPSSAERTLKRFKREAKETAQLIHPNIIRVTDYGEYNGAPYLVMPFIPGGTLKQKLNELHNPMPYYEAAKLLAPIAHALDVAHKRGIVHRDIKPANILITSDGNPLLTDFGIAKILENDRRTTELTGSGIALGTPEYMAPEQWLGKDIDGRADIYSLGVVFYEMVTGHTPFMADTVPAIMLKALKDPLPRPREYVKDIPKNVELVIFKALAREPEGRYRNAQEFADNLERLAENEGVKIADSKKRGLFVIWISLILFIIFVLFGIENLQKTLFKPNLFYPTSTFLVNIINGSTETSDNVTKTTIEKVITELKLTDTPQPKIVITPSLVMNTEPIDSFVGDHYSTLLRSGNGYEQAFIEAGEFEMGSVEGRMLERPIHKVYLNAFWINQLEISNEKYVEFLTDIKDTDKHEGSWYKFTNTNSAIKFIDKKWIVSTGKEKDPVVFVNWAGASAFCKWNGGRLPTEAEWEKAARGTDERRFPWGDLDPTCLIANYYQCIGRPAPVNNYPRGASPYNVWNLAGNVWEWTNDWFNEVYYFESPEKNPQGPSSGEYKVIRGGSWNYAASSLRSSLRFWANPTTTDIEIGFRCVYSK